MISPILLLVALTAFPAGPAQTSFGKPLKQPERGGALIDLTLPASPDANVKVMAIDGKYVVLSFGAERGARNGQEGILAADKRTSFLAVGEKVELLVVGMGYSIGRFKSSFLLSMALQNENNPVRKEGLVWIPLPGLPTLKKTD